VIMANARDKVNECLREAEKETLKLKCLQGYKNDLKDNVPKVKSMYEGYIQNYSVKDGSIIAINKEKRERTEIEKTMTANN